MLNKDDTNFAIRTYGKSELALLYFPEANTSHTAVNHLMSWVNRCKDLKRELEKAGYKKTAKYFTPKEVTKIVEYLGYP